MDNSNKNPEIINFDKESFYLFHNNIDTKPYAKHWHNAVEIIMPIVNSYGVQVAETSYLLNEYDVLIIPSGQPH